MKHIRRIQAGVEFAADGAALTAGSLQAVREAAWLAERTGAHLALFHSRWNDERGEPGAAPSDAAVKRALDAVSAAGPAVDAEFVVADERPWLAMVRSAVRGETDLLCVGRRSTTEHPGLGSVTGKLVRNCPAPVWAVRPGAPAPPKRVLVATDLSPASDLATELALDLAAFAGADVRITHAWQVPFELVHAEGRASDARIEAERRAIQEGALAHVRGTLAGHDAKRVKIHVVCDSPIHAIENDVKEHAADLVALGTVSRGGIAGFLIGNTAERILRRIETSVLAVKPADFLCPVEG